MSTAKNEVQSLLDKLPDDCTLEDVQYHLYVVEKVHRGIDRADKVGEISQQDVERRLSKRNTEQPGQRTRLKTLNQSLNIERDSPFYAQYVVSKILEASRNIKELPLVGRIVPEISDENIRCWKILERDLINKHIIHHFSRRKKRAA